MIQVTVPNFFYFNEISKFYPPSLKVQRGGGQIFLHSFTEEALAQGGKFKHSLTLLRAGYFYYVNGKLPPLGSTQKLCQMISLGFFSVAMIFFVKILIFGGFKTCFICKIGKTFFGSRIHTFKILSNKKNCHLICKVSVNFHHSHFLF